LTFEFSSVKATVEYRAIAPNPITNTSRIASIFEEVCLADIVEAVGQLMACCPTYKDIFELLVQRVLSLDKALTNESSMWLITCKKAGLPFIGRDDLDGFLEDQ
jgi:hypothetical protein